MNYEQEIEQIEKFFEYYRNVSSKEIMEEVDKLLSLSKKMQEEFARIKEKERAYGRDYYRRNKQEILSTRIKLNEK